MERLRDEGASSPRGRGEPKPRPLDAPLAGPPSQRGRGQRERDEADELGHTVYTGERPDQGMQTRLLAVAAARF